MTYQCPKCGGDELDHQVKVWVRFPEREVEAEDAWEAESALGGHAVCRNSKYQHSFQISKKVSKPRPAGFCLTSELKRASRRS